MFAGREKELSQLRAASRARRGGVVLVTGEAGIGKTRLIEEAVAGDAKVVWGAAWDGGGAPAFWPWTQVLRALAAMHPEVENRRDLPSLEAVATQDSEALQFRVFDGLRSVLEHCSPLIVVLDDLHAADVASLQAVRFLAKTLRNLPVLVIGAHRDTDLPEVTAALLARIASSATTIRLAPLTREELARMVEPALLGPTVEVTGGNPLFVQEVLLRIGAGGGSPQAGMRAAIRDRLANLPAETRAVLEMAAVFGRETPAPVLREACGFDVDQALRAARGIISSPDPVRFNHPLFWECSYSARPALHLRAADVLRRRQGDVESIARHLIAALPESDSLETSGWADRAGAHAFRSLAFDRAVQMWEGALHALRLVPGHDGERIDIELRLAAALSRTGAAERARAVCMDAATRARGDVERFARAALAYGSEMRIAVVDEDLVRLLEDALASLPAGSLRALVMARLAAAKQPAKDAQVPIDAARRALALGRSVDDRETLMEVLHWAGAAYAGFAHPIDRLPVARELAALALQRRDLVRAQQAYMRVAIAASELCAWDELDDAVEAHHQLGVALGHPRWQWQSALLLSMRALLTDRWDEAMAAQEQAAASCAEAEDLAGMFMLSAHRLSALRARGVGTLADVHACINLAPPEMRAAHADRGALARAATLARLGYRDAARDVLVGMPLPPSAWQPSPLTLAMCADVAVGTGDRELAMVVLPKLQELEWPALGSAVATWEGPLTQWIGGLSALLGRIEEARAAFEDAVTTAELAGARTMAQRIQRQLDALSAASAPGSRRAQTSDATFTLTREGEVWAVASGGKTARLKHSRGIELLHELIQSPEREYHVLDLALLGQGAEGGVVDRGDAGEVLDARAIDAYRERLRALDEELSEAEAWADSGRRERLAAERDFLVAELARGAALQNRSRRVGAATERARVNVQKRLREAIRRVTEVLPEVGEQLKRSIKTGTQVSYRPPARL